MGAATPPIEWVSGRAWAWVGYWLLLLGGGASSMLALLAIFGLLPEYPVESHISLFASTLALLPISFVQLFRPINRRIGLSPVGIVWDNGVRKFAYPWTRVVVENPLEVIGMNSGMFSSNLKMHLTPEQASRVKWFLDSMYSQAIRPIGVWA